MSRMYKREEVSEWVREWREYYGSNVTGFRKRAARTYGEQLANYLSCTNGGKVPHWCDPAEYRDCLDYLWVAAKYE